MRGHSSLRDLVDRDREIDLGESGFDRGEVHFAVALGGVRVAGPDQRAAHEHRHVQRRAFDQVTVVEIAGERTRRNRVVASGLRARDAERSGRRTQRNFDAGGEFGDLALPIQIEIFHLAVGKFLRELAEQAGHVEIGAPRPRHDLVDLDLQDVARLGAVDEHRTGDGHRAASGPIGAQLLDLVDGAARPQLAVRMRHGFENDRVAGIDRQPRQFGIVEPAPLRGLQGRRQDVHLARQPRGLHEHELLRPGHRLLGDGGGGDSDGERAGDREGNPTGGDLRHVWPHENPAPGQYRATCNRSSRGRARSKTARECPKPQAVV